MEIEKELNNLGLINFKNVYRNLSVCKLVENSILRGEGNLTLSGALNINTGKYTGRSPKDRYIVDSKEIHNDINWGDTNIAISEENFERLYARLLAYFQNKDIYVFDGFVGADKRYSMSVRFINELSSQNLFVHQLFIRPTKKQLEDFYPDFTVICAPGFKANPETDGTNSEAFVIINIERKLIIIGGTMYCGELKKSIFSVMNYFMPKYGILSMHCSANIGKENDTALFFGLSGTGKTTLSADPERRLIGDDEHGWSEDGIFNFEGGCYAKCINLSKENEPQIWNAIRFGTLIENVVIDGEGREDYADSKYTENTRAAYPIEYIPNAATEGIGSHPKTILFLTADAFGVLPPISKLSKEQAMYHFVSGYTSKIAGTERGIKEPVATFSACYGEPFMLLNPLFYAKMLGEKIEKYNVNVYLVNTGWIKGPYGVGERISLSYTRSMVRAAITGELDNAEYELHPIFNVLMPKKCSNVPEEILNQVNTWNDKQKYYDTAYKLLEKFNNNYKKFHIPEFMKEAASALR
ncbi:phosphoenolpyruvate carboxykinase (ATP) [Caloramator quimbayensis]|uniref:Phosphoenolpyruvate carboxykinase (ATP) n=1 Tax=Caloramator quimbayensis TaxID=1147123 RepID=A0A1T4X2G5_9CLOT|nr:phosphoenolpyruvate carboxykinase (ATP) [Caloramator quimbayensis]SKA83746.1 phosphoenolpyruvate carboxykinase (ATP) [Caloramator quimbayensis]